MVVFYYLPYGLYFDLSPGVGDGQWGLAFCDSWGRKESDTTEQLIWSDLIWHIIVCYIMLFIILQCTECCIVFYIQLTLTYLYKLQTIWIVAWMCVCVCAFACVCACTPSFSLAQFFATPGAVACQVLCPWDSTGENTGVGCHFLLQGVFLTQGWSNSWLLHCRHILYHLSHQGNTNSDIG